MQTHKQSPNTSGTSMAPYIAIAAGLLTAVLGFGLDLLWHDVWGTAGHDEAVITISNPGHLLVGFGAAVVLSATASGIWRSNPTLAVATATVIAAVAVSFAVYGSLGVHSSEAGGQVSQHERAASHSHPVEVMEGANHEED